MQTQTDLRLTYRGWDIGWWSDRWGYWARKPGGIGKGPGRNTLRGRHTTLNHLCAAIDRLESLYV